jgi:hypothetical protein
VEQQEAEDDSQSLEERQVLCISLGQGISLFLRERQEQSSGPSRKGKRVRHLAANWTPERETRELLAELGVIVEE